uniref:Uncharacterized protein n=1 Tax=Plectus sambesii TaxID=2011161 RepID=A0A914V0M2_9BILA
MAHQNVASADELEQKRSEGDRRSMSVCNQRTDDRPVLISCNQPLPKSTLAAGAVHECRQQRAVDANYLPCVASERKSARAHAIDAGSGARTVARPSRCHTVIVSTSVAPPAAVRRREG